MPVVYINGQPKIAPIFKGYRGLNPSDIMREGDVFVIPFGPPHMEVIPERGDPVVAPQWIGKEVREIGKSAWCVYRPLNRGQAQVEEEEKEENVQGWYQIKKLTAISKHGDLLLMPLYSDPEVFLVSKLGGVVVHGWAGMPFSTLRGMYHPEATLWRKDENHVAGFSLPGNPTFSEPLPLP